MADSTTTKEPERIYATRNIDTCGRCGKPTYRYGFRGVHLKCTSCDWTSAKFWPKGAVAPDLNQ